MPEGGMSDLTQVFSQQETSQVASIREPKQHSLGNDFKQKKYHQEKAPKCDTIGCEKTLIYSMRT